MEPMDYDCGAGYSPEKSNFVESPMQHSGWEDYNSNHVPKCANLDRVPKDGFLHKWHASHSMLALQPSFDFAEDHVTASPSHHSEQFTFMATTIDSHPGPIGYKNIYDISPNKHIPAKADNIIQDEEIYKRGYDLHTGSFIADPPDKGPVHKKKHKSHVKSAAPRKLCDTPRKKKMRLGISDSDDESTSASASRGTDSKYPVRLSCVSVTVVLCIFLAWSLYKIINFKCFMDIHYDYENLRDAVNRDVYGQHIAAQLVPSTIEGYLLDYKTSPSNIKPLVLSLHGSTGVGKNYITQIVTRFFPVKTVTLFLIPLHFAHNSDSDLYASQIYEWVMTNVTQCKVSIFIIDEMDKAPAGFVSGLQKAILDLSVSKLGFTPVIIFLLSNSKGSEITRRVINFGNDKIREDISFDDLKDLFRDENQWYSELLSRDLMTVVPFLPLERRHVVQCIIREVSANEFSLADHSVDEVLGEMTFFTSSHGQQFSQTGCKRVLDKVQFVFSYN